MPDILIRMEMPPSCADCPIKGDSCCKLSRQKVKYYHEDRRDDCPLVELPEHGDLIDRDALLAEYERDERAADEHGREFSFSFDSGGARCTEWWIVQQKLMDAPVIIPTEKGE